MNRSYSILTRTEAFATALVAGPLSIATVGAVAALFASADMNIGADARVAHVTLERVVISAPKVM